MATAKKIKLVNTNDDENNDAWSERGDYWLQQSNPELSYNDRKRRAWRKPLILTGHGVRLRVDRGTLLLRNGFTHYPQVLEEYRFFPRDRRLPSRIIILDSDGGMTFDALAWLAEQDIPLIHLNWRGEVINISGTAYAADPELSRIQLEIKNSKHGFEFAKWLILNKIQNSQAVIEKISNNSPAAELFIKQFILQAEAIKNNQPTNLNALLGIEGIAASAYFRYWQSIPLKWKGTGRQPVPDDWLRIGSRIAGNKSNQYARHPVNAMLNYAYGMLENQVRAQLVSMGFDPTIGYIHSTGYRRYSMVYDLMEPLRPVVDLKILEFIQENVFSPQDFILNKNGTCRLHPQFARMVVKLIQDLPEVETTTINNLNKLMALHPLSVKKATRNMSAFKPKLIGSKE